MPNVSRFKRIRRAHHRLRGTTQTAPSPSTPRIEEVVVVAPLSFRVAQVVTEDSVRVDFLLLGLRPGRRPEGPRSLRCRKDGEGAEAESSFLPSFGFMMFEFVESRIPESSSFFPVFFTAFCMVYVLAYNVVFRNWSAKLRPEASSCVISLVHGTPAVVLAACAILAQPERGFSSPNTRFQVLVLDFSVGYFAVDLLHYLVNIPGDYLYISHHVATLFVFVTCRYLAFHGAFSLLVLLVLAEVTSFCQNIWTLAAMRKSDSPVAAKIYNSLSPPFYALYSLARVIAGPVFFVKMSCFYLSGQASDVISWWISLSWVVVVGGAISVSILWVFNNWLELFRERTQNGKAKKL